MSAYPVWTKVEYRACSGAAAYPFWPVAREWVRGWMAISPPKRVLAAQAISPPKSALAYQPISPQESTLASQLISPREPVLASSAISPQ